MAENTNKDAGIIEKWAGGIFVISAPIYTLGYLIGADTSIPRVMLIILSIVMISFVITLFCFGIRTKEYLKEEEG